MTRCLPLPFMGALVPRVLSGAKTVTRRTGRVIVRPGDLVYITEAWRLPVALDDLSGNEALALSSVDLHKRGLDRDAVALGIVARAVGVSRG